MQRTNWKDIAELVGIAAIVASLVFVGMQMRQDRTLARAELGAGSFESLATLRLEMTSPDFAVTYARMLENPEELTTSEKLQVNGYLDAVKYLLIRECYLKERGVFTECTVMVNEYTPFFFGNRYAQAWWRLQSPRKLSFLPGWVDEVIRGIDPKFNLRQLEEIECSGSVDHSTALR